MGWWSRERDYGGGVVEQRETKVVDCGGGCGGGPVVDRWWTAVVGRCEREGKRVISEGE